MREMPGTVTRFAAMIALALLMSLPGVASAQSTRLNGVVQGLNRRLNYVTVRDQATGRVVKVDVRRVNTRDSIDVWELRGGDSIVVDGGWENRDTFQAERVNFARVPPREGSANGVRGVVQSLNPRLNYLTVRDETTGRDVRVDVRRMDRQQSIDVWQLHVGDIVRVEGIWDGRDTIRADRVDSARHGRNGGNRGDVLKGVVESVNRRLSYITVRDQSSGRIIKVDVREMNIGRSVDVWRLRSGDRVFVNGGWEDRDTFQADTVNASTY